MSHCSHDCHVDACEVSCACHVTVQVTHLIAGQVGTTKYHVARRLGLPVLRPSWVHKSWDVTISSSLMATETSVLDQHLCLPFTGCTIAVTGLDEGARKRVKESCQKSGGHYSGELTKGVCTHLLVGSKSSKSVCGVSCIRDQGSTGFINPAGSVL